jgi:hypothetical protein
MDEKPQKYTILLVNKKVNWHFDKKVTHYFVQGAENA